MSSKEMTSRRTFLKTALAGLAVPPMLPGSALASGGGAIRSVNVVNFIRAEEPREPLDLLQPVREQMRLLKQFALPGTWLLQYDSLVEGPFVALLQAEMPPSHETGIWFEMNRRICDAAGVAWRGKPDWEWDPAVPVAYSIGYTPDERRRLADAVYVS